jgi:hypothetical protein
LSSHLTSHKKFLLKKLDVLSDKHFCLWCLWRNSQWLLWYNLQSRSLSDLGCKHFTYSLHTKILEKYNLGFIPCLNSYGVISTDNDDALFSVKAVVSKALFLKYNCSFYRRHLWPFDVKQSLITSLKHTIHIWCFRKYKSEERFLNFLGVC